ncbi:DUF927 domain-containing protein, partial [Methylohalobius crimeensis]|uniref:DUF927 domain-containing protein n=2 Tax=Methylohalobius crimeensis TaxID=244365 RepID=UPI0003B79690
MTNTLYPTHPQDIERFRRAILDSGLPAPEQVNADGRIHRFPTTGKRDDDAGWYVLHLDGIPAGAFGCWRAGITQSWCAKDRAEMNQEERRAHAKRLDEIQRQRQQEIERRQSDVSVRASNRWREAKPAEADHPYLERKRIRPNGAKMDGDKLVIPGIDAGGTLWTLQTITGEGDKRFLPGGKKRGCFFPIPLILPESPECIVICEGFATAASLHEATGLPTFAAFDAGNLKPVAEALRKQYPKAGIVIAGDNDQWTEGNPGAAKARGAADAVGAAWCVPDFSAVDTDTRPTDFNDLAGIAGLETVKTQIQGAVAQAVGIPPAPFGHLLNRRGVFRLRDDGEPQPLAHRPIWVEALSRDGRRESWGRLVVWEDHDGHRHERAIPASMFHTGGREIAQLLAEGGLPIVSGKETPLLQYLVAFAPKDRLTAATVTGWHGQAFVLPDRTLKAPEGERIVYQPHDQHTAADAFCRGGTFDAWQWAVAEAPSLVRFAVCAALAAPMRHLVEVEAGGFHFHGNTSRGKTTLLQAAASVWGNSADPQQAGGAAAYIQRWNATDNGLEATAECFNDLPLIVDEIGESETRDFGRTIYRIMSGSGRRRANVGGGLRRAKSWRVLILSAGELPAAEYAAQEGRQVRGGQLVRLADVPIDGAPLFRDGGEVDHLKQAFAHHFGHAGPRFIESVTTEKMAEAWRGFDPEAIGPAATPEAVRVRKRFALAACAGELAIKHGLLPWRPGQAIEAARLAYRTWQSGHSAATEGERGIVNLQAFILRHEARFEREDNDPPKERAGWFR